MTYPRNIRHHDAVGAVAVVIRRLGTQRQRDLQLQLVSALTAWTMTAVLVARAREAADLEAAARLQRERARAKASLINVLDDIDDAGIGTEDLVAALLADEAAPALLVGE
jgi:hypothetical protein